MAIVRGLDMEDSTTIGFVVACLFAKAIDVKELQAWADHVLLANDVYPPYILDLSTFDLPLAQIYRVIGFAPVDALTDAESDALTGITYMRGNEPFDEVIPREQAIAAIAAHPYVVTRFRETFPFIDLHNHVA